MDINKINHEKESINRDKKESSENLEEINLILSIINKVMEKTPFHAFMINQAATSNAFSILPSMIGKYTEGELTLFQPQKGGAPFPRSLVHTHQEMIDKWKVIVNISYDNKVDFVKIESKKMRVLRKLTILPPNHVCTANYLICATYDTEKEAKNCVSYLKTKFVRFLISRIISGGSVSRKAFKMVPVQEMNEEWSDEKLYEKYELTEKEREMIESKIREH